jgi:hypothetical protein
LEIIGSFCRAGTSHRSGFEWDRHCSAVPHLRTIVINYRRQEILRRVSLGQRTPDVLSRECSHSFSTVLVIVLLSISSCSPVVLVPRREKLCSELNPDSCAETLLWRRQAARGFFPRHRFSAAAALVDDRGGDLLIYGGCNEDLAATSGFFVLLTGTGAGFVCFHKPGFHIPSTGFWCTSCPFPGLLVL